MMLDTQQEYTAPSTIKQKLQISTVLDLALKVIQTTLSFVCSEIFFDALMNY